MVALASNKKTFFALALLAFIIFFSSSANAAVNVSFVTPTLADGNFSGNSRNNWVYVNVSYQNTSNIDSVVLNWNGSNETNSMDCSSGYNCWINYTAGDWGNYSFYVFLNQSDGAKNQTSNRWNYLDICGTISVAHRQLHTNVSAVTGGICLSIGTDDVVLDGNGFYVVAETFNSGTAVSSPSWVNAPVIKNLGVTRFFWGVTMSSPNAVIRNSTFIYMGSRYNIDVVATSNATVFNNTFKHMSGGAVQVGTGVSYDCNVSYNTFQNGTAAVALYLSANNTFVAWNAISDFRAEGVDVNSANYSRIYNNVISQVGISSDSNPTLSAAIWVEPDSYYNDIQDNSLTNSKFGIRFGNHGDFNTARRIWIDTTDYGIYFDADVTGNYIYDSSVYNSNNASVYGAGSGNSNTLVNTTFDKTNVSIVGGTLYVKWYLNVRVLNNQTSQPVSGATVNVSNVNNNSIFYGLTGSNGYIAQQTVFEYLQTSGGVTNYTPHNITAQKSPPNSTISYVTQSRDVIVTLNSPGSGNGYGGSNPANPSNLTNTTWPGWSSANPATLAGGNITNATLNAQSQTWKWCGFYGDIYANLTLKDAAGNSFYYWRVLNVSGAVTAVQNSSPSWDLVNIIPLTGAEVDAVFFPSDTSAADNATQTFNSTSWGGTVAGKSISSGVSSAGFKPFGAGNWNVEALNISSGNAVNASTGFVANINRGQTLYNGGTGDYELMVPARNPDLTSIYTYYFFVQLT